MVAEGRLPVSAVEPLAGDDAHPAKAVLLAVSNEPKDFPLRLAHRESVQVALRFDLETRVLERVKHASVRVGAVPSDDPVALSFDHEPSTGPARRFRRCDGSRLRDGHDALVRPERLHPREGPLELPSIPVIILVPSHPAMMNRPPGLLQFAQRVRQSRRSRRFFASEGAKTAKNP